MEEIWKDINRFEGYYQASNLGRIKELDKYIYNTFGKKEFVKSRIINPFKNKNGTMFIILKKEYSSKTYTLSRIVYEAFNSDFDYNDRRVIVEFKDENKSNIELSNLYTISRKDKIVSQKAVFCLTTKQKFKSIQEASDYYNIQRTGVASCCRGVSLSCGKLEDGTKLVWMYLDDYNKSTKEEIELKIHNANKPIERIYKNIITRKVICITTGEKFESIKEADKFYNISQGNINRCCSGKSYSAGKLPDGTRLVWKYLDD